MRKNNVIIKPTASTSEYFATQILSDLVTQGYEGNILVKKYEETQGKIKPAIEKMLIEADNVAAGKSESYSYDDIFNSELEA